MTLQWFMKQFNKYVHPCFRFINASDYSENIMGSYVFCFSKMTKLYWFWVYIEHMLIVKMSQCRENCEWILVRNKSVYMARSIYTVCMCVCSMCILALFYVDINENGPIAHQMKSQPSLIQLYGILSEHKTIFYLIINLVYLANDNITFIYLVIYLSVQGIERVLRVSWMA